MSAARIFPTAMALTLGFYAALTSPAGAQVIYFQRPPTADQLRAALLAPPAAVPARPGAATSLPSGTGTRGIVWQTPGNRAVAGTATTTASASASAPLPASITTTKTAVGGSPAAALPINFDLGSSRVESGSMTYIESIASVLRADPSIHLVIEGHTDDRGTFNRNMVLSWDRALGVFRTLVESYGIDPNRLQPVGKGPMDPMPGTNPSDGSNRRVQFRVNG